MFQRDPTAVEGSGANWKMSGWVEKDDYENDRPILLPLLANGANSVVCAVGSTLQAAKAKLAQVESDALLEVARMKGEAAAASELRSSTVLPWLTLSE